MDIAVARPRPLRLTIRPQTVYIEQGRSGQFLNFDLVVENDTTETLTLTQIQVSVFTKQNQFVLRRFVDDNGSLASIQTLPQREVMPQGALLIFNPFFCFEPDIPLHRLDYQISLVDGAGAEYDVEATVLPEVYTSRSELYLPAWGRLLVWDGHDFYSHHRRFNYLDPRLQPFGVTTNFMRYAYDFVPVTETGAMTHGDPERNENWLGWGTEVRAPGRGVVVAAADGLPDNRQIDAAATLANPMCLCGNYIVLDHQNGEYSLLGHLQAGSVQVEVGAAVAPGQPLARLGASGSSLFPHLHYELRTGATLTVEGLPSAFRDFQRILGSRVIPVTWGTVDTGDILESAPG